jgi:hypothetical protein
MEAKGMSAWSDLRPRTFLVPTADCILMAGGGRGNPAVSRSSDNCLTNSNPESFEVREPPALAHAGKTLSALERLLGTMSVARREWTDEPIRKVQLKTARLP